jgi:D-proline reductase (dithiol) PrdD
VQEIRECLKKLDSSQASKKRDYYDTVRKDCRRVVLVKLVSGLGCMYETAIFPDEPGGCLGCRSIMDIANMQVSITPNQYKDGVIHSLC